MDIDKINSLYYQHKNKLLNESRPYWINSDDKDSNQEKKGDESNKIAESIEPKLIQITNEVVDMIEAIKPLKSIFLKKPENTLVFISDLQRAFKYLEGLLREKMGAEDEERDIK